MDNREKELSKARIKKLGELLCDTISNNGRCIAVDFIHDIANIVTVTELNSQVMATRIDLLEEKIQLLETNIRILSKRTEQ